MFEKSSKSRGVFGTQASIYDEAFSWIYLTAYFFHNKSSIIDVQLGYVQVSENVKFFKAKLRWSKSSRLLQSLAILVRFWLRKHNRALGAIALESYGSNRPEVFYQKGVLKNFSKFTRKHQTQACNFIRKDTLKQVFSCEFYKIFRTPFYIQEHLQWLLLKLAKTKYLSYSEQMFLSYKDQWTDLYCQSIEWFLYDLGIEHKWVRLRTAISSNYHVMNLWIIITMHRVKTLFL